jgi:alpha-L-rhamnosidase
MSWFLHQRTARGLVLARQYTSFDDPLAYITGEGTALNAFIYQALRDSAGLARVIEEQAQAEDYVKAAAALGESFNQHLWNAAEGTYNSGFVKDKSLGPTAHAALLALDRGIVPADRRPSVRKWFLAHYKRPGSFHCCSNPDFEKMVADRAGIDMPVTYYWVFQELYRMDSPAMDLEAVSEMRRRWGRMVRESDDTGTLWETFGGSESCHNYGAVPAYFLSSFVLGVRLDGPVWDRRLVIEPRLGDLSHAEGVVVTEFGPVPVSWKRQDGELVFRFEVPKGIKATLRVPDGDAATLVLDGQKVPANAQGRHVIAAVSAGVHEGRLTVQPPPTAMPSSSVIEQ